MSAPSEPTDRRPLDLTMIRRQFPALRLENSAGIRPIFFDGPGGTQVPVSVMSAMTDYLTASNSNIEGEYEASVRTDELIASARARAGVFVNGDPGGVVFGQNATTLNFLISRAFGRLLQPGDEIVTTVLDHDANVAPWILLAEDRGLVVRQVGVTRDLELDLDDLAAQLSPRTKVVAYTLASNAVGSLTPAAQVADLAHQVGALAWVDAVHYASHRRVDVSSIGCDVLLCSPYKFFGPHLGMAWLRPELAASWPAERVRPAGDQPPGHRFETGTLSHEALAGFVATIEYLTSLGRGSTADERLKSGYRAIAAHEQELTDLFMSRLAGLNGWRLLGVQEPDAARRVATFGLLHDTLSPSELARALGREGYYTWNGNFYALNLVRHLKMDTEEGMLRVGFAHYNTRDEVAGLIDCLAAITAAELG